MRVRLVPPAELEPEPTTTRELRPVELAKLAGVSTDTLRHYERVGVLPAPRRLANGYRSYSAADLERVQVVRAALAIGFTLEELRPLLRARDRGRPPCREGRALAAEKLEAAQAQLVELEAHVRALRALLLAWDEKLLGVAPGEAVRLLENLPPPQPRPRRPSRPPRQHRKGKP